MLPHQSVEPPPPSYVPRPGPSYSPAPVDALARDFPTVSALSKEDLQDLLSDEAYFNAVFEGLPQVRRMREAQAEVIASNEALAGKSKPSLSARSTVCTDELVCVEKNLAVRPQLEASRERTAASFANANAMKAKWADVEARQAELHKVRPHPTSHILN